MRTIVTLLKERSVQMCPKKINKSLKDTLTIVQFFIEQMEGMNNNNLKLIYTHLESLMHLVNRR